MSFEDIKRLLEKVAKMNFSEIRVMPRQELRMRAANYGLETYWWESNMRIRARVFEQIVWRAPRDRVQFRWDWRTKVRECFLQLMGR